MTVDVSAVLQYCQVQEEQIQAFGAQFAEHFGKAAALNAANRMCVGTFEQECARIQRPKKSADSGGQHECHGFADKKEKADVPHTTIDKKKKKQ